MTSDLTSAVLKGVGGAAVIVGTFVRAAERPGTKPRQRRFIYMCLAAAILYPTICFGALLEGARAGFSGTAQLSILAVMIGGLIVGGVVLRKRYLTL